VRRRRVIAAIVFSALAFALLPVSASSALTVAQARARAVELQRQIEGLNMDMKSAAGQFTDAQQQLLQTQAQITENEGLLAQAQIALADAQTYLEQRVVSMYKTPTTQVMDVLMGSSSFSELADGLDVLQRLQRQDVLNIANADQARVQAVNRQALLDGERAQAGQLMEAMKVQQKQINETLALRRSMLRSAQADVKVALAQLAAQRAAAASRAYGAGTFVSTASGQYTPTTWAREFLREASLPLTPSNLAAIMAWERAEGGHWCNSAHYNPLNTTMSAPGATSMNWVGVKAYTSWAQGFTATVKTLYNGYYAGIIAALRHGDNGQAVADAVAASPWGTGSFVVH
jgi:peptidoglycan hydrolase CwlO-like protein